MKTLHGKHAGAFRLRIGDYRIFFKPTGEILRILNVRHRSEAYR
ncbi:MAG: type II toxin-antitoxin system RelE/ParE family toxin [Candidatus Solibacter usitatus]|nr:type II toxin-antitoxin system RelE/ParE family toxin [Candidatus Solibacter usitatus]